jgi:uncharacterized protein (DUF4415 family)
MWLGALDKNFFAKRRHLSDSSTGNRGMKGEYYFSEGRRGANEPALPGITRITIRFDNDVLDWFRYVMFDTW